MTPVVLRLDRMNRGAHFRTAALRDKDRTGMLDPVLGVDHAWMSAPTFPAHSHSGFRGVVHEEIPAEAGQLSHLFQIFIDLPASKQEAAPYALSLEPETVPVAPPRTIPNPFRWRRATEACERQCFREDRFGIRTNNSKLSADANPDFSYFDIF